jgi:hypothetical protein
MAPGPSADLSTTERKWIESVRSTDTLADLVRITSADSEHEAYIEAKQVWFDLVEKESSPILRVGGLPGDRVRIDGRTYWIHGVTHADTDAEREYLRKHVFEFLDAVLL